MKGFVRHLSLNLLPRTRRDNGRLGERLGVQVLVYACELEGTDRSGSAGSAHTPPSWVGHFPAEEEIFLRCIKTQYMNECLLYIPAEKLQEGGGQGYRATELQRDRATELQRYRATEVQSGRNPRTCAYLIAAL